ncbi:extracellular solute-binding protein [Paenibacillus flagellatus]|uniref:GntR family transcriptional regulator n=1 Tax=Paenibacillus flagellatus TaxID=2211139 RepID=A0A2V5KPI6_9BACL|nr:extracellular solute-binding protein [Paenibacillus flagellatus]PYI57400.1 GntR family transcriptional regulator [Paenibacillus flagellatus]
MKKKADEFKKLMDEMIQALKHEISTGRYEALQYLPSEKMLAERFGLSNNSVRKGLDTLVEEGWIDKIPRVGNRVRFRTAPVALTVLCNPNSVRDVYLEALLADFRTSYPSITVTIRTVDDNPGFAEAPNDVLLLNEYQFRAMVERERAGMLESVPAKEEIYPFLRDWFTHGERLAAQPLVFGPVVLCYNKNHFVECGLQEPNGGWRWSDLMLHARKLTESGHYGFCFHLPALNRWPLFLLQSGEGFQWENGRIRDFRGTRLMEGIRLCKEIIHNRNVFPLYWSEGNNDINQMFLDGKLSMVLTSYLGLNEWKQTSLDYDVSPVPFIAEPRTMAIAIAAGVNADSKHKQEAHLLVDYLSSRHAQRMIRRHTFGVPAFRDAHSGAESGNPQLPSRHSLYREMLFSYRTHRDLNIPVTMIASLFRELKAYWADMIDEDELWERLRTQLTEP